MKLVIDIDKDIAQGIIDGKGEIPRNIVRSFQATIADAIKNGIPLEDELDRLKEKINSEDVNCQYEEDYVYSSGLQKSIEVINNRIEELKGE